MKANVHLTDYRDRVYEQYPEKHVGWQDTRAHVYRKWAKGAAAHLRGWLPKDKNAACLDLGCGPGNVLYVLRELGYRNTTGVDLSEAWMPIARQICPNVIQADAKDYLRTHRGQFDLITVFDVIEHLRKEDVLNFLDLAYEALRPGGSIVLQTPNAESPWGCAMRYGDFTHELAFDPQSLGDCCRLCGFERFESREVGPYVHGIPSLIRKAVWSTIRAGLMVWNFAEMGSFGSKVYTRVFLARAIRPTSAAR